MKDSDDGKTTGLRQKRSTASAHLCSSQRRSESGQLHQVHQAAGPPSSAVIKHRIR